MWALLLIVSCALGQEVGPAVGPADGAEDGDDLARLLAADEATFAELAARDEPDPWLVAARLAAAGKRDLARRFAGAKDRPAVAGLAAFLRADPAFDPAVRAVRDRALDRLDAGDAPRATLDAELAAIESVIGRANPLETVQLQSVRGFLRAYRGDVKEAQADFLAAAEGALALGWRRGAADAFGTASENARVLYDHAAAIRLAQRDLELRVELDDEETARDRLRRLVEIRSEIGAAEDALDDLARWRERLGAEVSLDRVALLLRLADPGTALAEAGAIDTARALLLAGDALRQLGRESDALARYRDAAERFGAEKDESGRGSALGNAGISLVRLGRPGEAKSVLEEAQRAFGAAGDPALEALAVLHRGDAALALGRAPVAARLFDAARSFATRTGDAWLEAESLVRRGRALLADDDLAGALRSFLAARAIASSRPLPMAGAAAALGESRVYAAKDQPALAAAAARAGLAALAPVVVGQPVPAGDEARRLHGELCAAAVRAASAQDSDAELWEALERLRLGLPLHSRGQVAALRARALDEDERAAEARLRRRIAELRHGEERANEEEDRARAQRFRAERERHERAQREILDAVRARSPYAALLLDPQPTPLPLVRPMIEAEEALVSVADGDGAGGTRLALVVGRAQVRRVRIAPDGKLAPRARRVTFIGPPVALEGGGRDVLRALSATEAMILRRTRAPGTPHVLSRPATVPELRDHFLAGRSRLFVPEIAIPAAQVESMRQRLARGEDVTPPPVSHWMRWGRR